MNKLTKIGLALIAIGTMGASALMIVYWSFISDYTTAIVAAVTLVIICYNLTGRQSELNNQPSTEDPVRVGKYLSVFQWNLIVRPVVSLTAGTIVAAVFKFADWYIETNVMNIWIFAGVALGMAVFFAQSENEDEVVPESYGAMLTFWGVRFKAYRKEGRYPWTGKLIGFGKSQTVHSEGTDKDGFIKLLPFPISIWNQKDQKGKVQLKSSARDTSEVTTTLTLTLQLLDPYIWIDSTDPALDLAEQARTAFRAAIAFFTGVDCTLVKSVFANLMVGLPILSVFLPKTINGYPKGSMLRDKGGVSMYTVIKKGSDETSVKEKFAKLIDSDADRIMLAECNSTQDSSVVDFYIAKRTVETAFADVLDRLGAHLVKAAVGNISLSEEVTREANKAASETFQRESQVASAKTFVEVGKIMQGVNELSLSDFDKAIAAAQDNPNVKVVATSGGDDSLKGAAATLAALTNGGNTNE
ncbi:MAG: hypothetical protein ACI9BF_000082 [Candidatus Paceibacteria bacterium]|jgi:hypothetical protein